MTLLDRLSTGWKAWVALFLITFSAAAPGVFLLPALDRDESRFAQASKQMLEDHDYIRIQYQDELRNKKPAGIHWLQAASTAVFTGPEAKQIWTYRFPSWIGASLAAVACFWCGIPLVGRRAAFLGAALFGSTLLLTSEAHISKTDAVLVCLTTFGIGALGRLYLREGPPKKAALLFWLAMGLGFLIKGPVTPMVAAYAGVGAWVWGRAENGKGGDWWRPLIWWPGPLLFVALVLPWFTWVQIATSGEFLQGAVGKDLKDKFTGASEGHGGWPFFHLTHLPVWFFPAILLIVPGLVASWKDVRQATVARAGRPGLMIGGALLALSLLLALVLPASAANGIKVAYPAVLLLVFGVLSTRDEWWRRAPVSPEAPAEVKGLRLLLSWTLLTWAFFELMPTLLSHYILPAYPGMALLCGYAAVRLIEGRSMPVSRWLSLALFGLGAALLLGVSYPGAAHYFMAEAAGDFSTASGPDVLSTWQAYYQYPVWLWWAAFALCGAAAIEFSRARMVMSIILAVAGAFVIGWHIRIFMLPSQVWVQPTETARLALEDVCGIPGEACAMTPPDRILALGYAEPSYILTMGTQNTHPPETPLDLPTDERAYPVVYLVNYEDRKAEPPVAEEVEHLRDQAQGMGLCITESEPYYALNYSNGDPVHFVAMRFDRDCGR
ncbi:MAG: dolichyl-phosphate-mannose--protein mannosyltransferase [Hyphomonas sp.]|nr:glycosyltransferase family 39 protein [Hyphomonas sp.]MBB39399.1 dolichyl-phosphate-mannose--protein mannosyltransferase [Hyphomonas sp.]|tara:strand:+ start:6864 stop:8858 length:1995 start_codon:yes stop_codon:yes gene_type:complete